MTTFGSTKEAIVAGKTRMEKAVEDFRKEAQTLRTGRANADASRQRPRRLSRHADAGESAGHGDHTGRHHDRGFAVGSQRGPLIDKAIRTSDLGLNPTNDGKVVRMPIPASPKSAARIW